MRGYCKTCGYSTSICSCRPEEPKREEKKEVVKEIHHHHHHEKKDDSDFLTSMVVGAVTDSTLIGTLVGGDIVGAALGDLFND